MKKPELLYVIEITSQGKFIVPRNMPRDIAMYFPGKTVEIAIKQVSEPHSRSQQGYYWAVIVDQIKQRFFELGEKLLPMEVHGFLKLQSPILRVQKINEETGQLIAEYIRSTSALKMWEYSFYIEDCIQLAAEKLDITIPPPIKCQRDFMFTQFRFMDESELEYQKRILSYIESIDTLKDLKRYFYQNPAWDNDTAIKSMFSERATAIKKIK